MKNYPLFYPLFYRNIRVDVAHPLLVLTGKEKNNHPHVTVKTLSFPPSDPAFTIFINSSTPFALLKPLLLHRANLLLPKLIINEMGGAGGGQGKKSGLWSSRTGLVSWPGYQATLGQAEEDKTYFPALGGSNI